MLFCYSSAVFGTKTGLDIGGDENNLFVAPGAKVQYTVHLYSSNSTYLPTAACCE